MGDASQVWLPEDGRTTMWREARRKGVRPNFERVHMVRPGGSVRLLAKRRAWYADEDDREGQDSGQGDGDGSGKYNPKDLDEANKIIQSLVKRLDERDAAHEAYKQQTEDRLNAIEKDRRKKLEEEGNYKELLNQATGELESMKAYKDRAASLEQIIREGNETLIQRIPEDRQGIVPVDYPPEKLRAWLDKNVPLLTKQPPPDYDAGAGGGSRGNGKTELSAAEKAVQERFGLTDEEVIAARKAMAESSFNDE